MTPKQERERTLVKQALDRLSEADRQLDEARQFALLLGNYGLAEAIQQTAKPIHTHKASFAKVHR